MQAGSMVSVNSKTSSNGQTARSKIRVTDEWGGAEVAEIFLADLREPSRRVLKSLNTLLSLRAAVSQHHVLE